MPRLRYYKNFEQIGENNGQEENGQDDDRGNVQQRNENDIQPTIRQHEPRGWWSTPNIITGLSNKQIETNIQYHKQQIKLLEEVLQDRALGLSRYIPADVLHMQQYEGLESESTRKSYTKNHKSEVRYHMKQLQPILKNIRKKYSTSVFEFCRSAWIEILEDYYNNERS